MSAHVKAYMQVMLQVLRQIADRYNIEMRGYPDDTPYPTYAQWVLYELRQGRYQRVAKLLAMELD